MLYLHGKAHENEFISLKIHKNPHLSMHDLGVTRILRNPHMGVWKGTDQDWILIIRWYHQRNCQKNYSSM
jgi:hypothetical protein